MNLQKSELVCIAVVSNLITSDSQTIRKLGSTMWRYTLYLYSCMYVGVSISATSSTEALTKLTHAFQTEKAEKVFQLADSYFDVLAGTPEFDAIYGQICIKLNKIDEAVFAFERAVSQKPSDFKSYYFLALSYAKQNNLHQAERVLNRLLALDIPRSLRNNIDDTLSLVRSKRQNLESNIIQRLSFLLGDDSNVNSGSLDDRVVVSGVEILLDENSLETSDQFARINYDFLGKWHRTQYDAWRLNLSLAQQSHQNLTHYNRTQGNITFGYEYAKSPYKLSFNGVASVMSLDEATYQQEVGLTSTIQFNLTNYWSLELNAKASSINNVQNESLDSTIIESSAGVILVVKNILSKFSFAYGKQNADLEIAEHFGRDFTALSLYLNYQISSSQSLAFNAQYRAVEHHKEHPFFLILRDEKLKNLSIEWRYKLTPDWRLLSRYSYYEKTSTIPIYEYNRSEWYLGASYDF